MSRKPMLAFMGIVAFIATVAPPVDDASSDFFWIHMIQHISMILVVAPLLSLGLPASRNGVMRSAIVVGVVHAAALWAWHMPVLYDAAMENLPLHALEHLTIAGSAVLFWRVVLDATVDRLKRVALVFVTMLQSGALGALIAFAPSSIYRWHEANTPAGHDVIAQQQLAGAIMWIPAGAVYLVLMLALLRKVLSSLETAEQS